MNTKKIIYGIVGLIIAAFLLYNSVYFTSLSEHMEMLKSQTFDPVRAIETFWEEAPEKLKEEALDMETFDQLLSQDSKELAEKYGKTLGIGAPYSLLIKGKAAIAKIQDEVITLQFEGNVDYQIRAGSIFSNTMREASGYFDLDEFETTMDFNLVAIEINNRIVKEIIAPVIPQLKVGAVVEFMGAADINLRLLPVKTIEIIPITLQIAQP